MTTYVYRPGHRRRSAKFAAAEGRRLILRLTGSACMARSTFSTPRDRPVSQPPTRAVYQVVTRIRIVCSSIGTAFQRELLRCQMTLSAFS